MIEFEVRQNINVLNRFLIFMNKSSYFMYKFRKKIPVYFINEKINISIK